MAIRVLSAIMFYPRGGSAHAARALAAGLRAQGCSVTMLAGSRSDLGGHSDARTFYGEVRSVDFDPALASGAPMKFDGPPGTAPLHPSFEERPDAPDVVFASLDDPDFERQVRAWSRALLDAGARDADVLHLHHLTPLNEAAARIAPEVPVVGHLHGTELLMLERIAEGAPGSWTYADPWAERLRAWAQQCDRLVVVPAGVARARELLGVPQHKLVAIPNGVDADTFRAVEVDRGEFWRRVLVESPQGWLPGQPPGSASYGAAEAAALADGTVLLYVGRFTAVKRLDLLIEAFGIARDRASRPAGLVLVGGHPGEWEKEHPAELSARLGVPDVFLAGWQPQDALPTFFSAADAAVMTSEREQFGQVLIEAMACGTPVIATQSLGPSSIVDDGVTGWLAAPEVRSLASVITAALDDPGELQQRARAARLKVCEHFTWSGIAGQLVDTFEQVIEGGSQSRQVQAAGRPASASSAAS
jgi:glycosyltransferase involved in cell wall biosynthesis